ncbi:MAG: TIR domain-containing protein [Sphingomonadales bacterium]
MSGGPSVFLSYARADRARVAPIADALASAGLEVWWDALIDSGAAFAKLIEKQLNEADAVVVCWSATSVESDWVRDEAAHGRDRKCLVPISVDGTQGPLGFRQYHAVDFSNWKGGVEEPQLQSLVRGIVGVSGTAEAPRHLVAAQPKRGLSRRTMLLAGSGAAAVVAAGGIAWFNPFATAIKNSVAVLPFANLSGDPSQAYFSDGLSEEVRAALARNKRLKVAAPTSSNKFRERNEDARTIASKLGVAFLLDGSVRRAGNTVRIAAELVDAATGFSKWSQTFERQMTDIFAVQSEIARTVAEALDIEVGASASSDKTPGGTTNVQAYEAYLRGRAAFELSADEASDRDALAQFEAAIAADPGYAAARAARSRTLTAIANQYTEGKLLRPLYDEAIAEAERAVKLAPDFADAQSALGYTLFTGRLDVRGARQPYERSLALGEGDADVLIRYAFYGARTGQFDSARKAVDRAISLDPLNPRAFRSLAAVLYAERRYAESIEPGQKALKLNPKMGVAHAAIGDALFAMGKLQEALAAYKAEPSPSFALAGLAIVQHRLGDEAASQKALKDLIAKFGDAASYQQAQVYAQLGQTDAALDALDRARKGRDGGLGYMRNDPMIDSLRETPRFVALIKELGFE